MHESLAKTKIAIIKKTKKQSQKKKENKMPSPQPQGIWVHWSHVTSKMRTLACIKQDTQEAMSYPSRHCSGNNEGRGLSSYMLLSEKYCIIFDWLIVITLIFNVLNISIQHQSPRSFAHSIHAVSCIYLSRLEKFLYEYCI